MTKASDLDWPQVFDYARILVRRFNLDLAGLQVLTEGATGPYSASPLIAATANAAEIHCVIKDSSFGTAGEAEQQVRGHFERTGTDQACLSFYKSWYDAPLATVDIVTNSGNLRPMDRTFLERLTPRKAVVCLMWEPWELRPGEIDVTAAKLREIPVIGTNEHSYPNDLRGYTRLWALKLLELHGEPIVGSHFAVIGDQSLIADNLADFLPELGADVELVRTDQVTAWAASGLQSVDYVLVAEHSSRKILLGPAGLIDTHSLDLSQRTSPLRVGVLAGNVNVSSLSDLGVDVFPLTQSPGGFLTFPPWVLGYPLVMTLMAAGLKVGEVASREIRSGGSVSNAIDMAVQSGFGLAVEP